MWRPISVKKIIDQAARGIISVFTQQKHLLFQPAQRYAVFSMEPPGRADTGCGMPLEALSVLKIMSNTVSLR
jgi:hypothetical protein